MHDKIDATLALRSGGRLLVGRDRIAILEAIAQQGSITNAAKALGFSYKAAWDAMAAINNLLPQPAVITQAGGQRGGGAVVTDEGLRLIVAFRRLEAKLTRISTLIAEEGLDTDPDLLFWSVAMKTSARNVLRCTVTEVRRAAVNVEIIMKLSDEHSIIAVITNDSVRELGLEPGREVIALVKSSFVMLAAGEDALRISTPNRIVGTIAGRVDGGVNSEITLDLGSGKTLVSVITKASADELSLNIGDRTCAFFNPSHVILATG
jgi:molybdate transport system regulatory protein